MADITMPQLGETVTEGTITRWFKEVGEEIAEDEVLFEVSTDKVDSEVPSPASGTVTEILVPEGETVDVGTVLARVGDGSGAPAAPARDDQAGADQQAPEDGQAQEEQAQEQQAPEGQAQEAQQEQEPSPAEPSPTAQGASQQAASSPTPDGPSAAPTDQAPAPGGAVDGGDGQRSRLLSPVVRRLIAENDLDPDTIEGTGAGGRITRNDVQQVIDAGARSGGWRRCGGVGGDQAPGVGRRAGSQGGTAAAVPRRRPPRGRGVQVEGQVERQGDGTGPDRRRRRRGRPLHQHPPSHR